MKRKILVLLCLMLAVCALLCSCGDDDATTTTTTSNNGGGGNRPASKWDEVPKFNQSITFQLNEYSDSEFDEGGKKYIQGPDKSSADKVQALVYDRNIAATEQLGVTVEYTYINKGWSQGSTEISNAVASGVGCDMYSDMIYDMMIATFKSSFRNVQTMTTTYVNKDGSQGGYLDMTEANGWMMEFMEGLRFSTDKQYLLGSKYYLDLVRGMTVMPVNLDLYQSSVKDTTQFFQDIMDGLWTWDYLIDNSRKVFNDKRNDGADMTDVLGFAAETLGGKTSSGIVYSTDIHIVKQVMDKDGKTYQFTYGSSSEVLINLFDKIASVFAEGNGVSVASAAASTQAQGEEIRDKFAEGTLLFGGCIVMGSIEAEVYQNDMKASFGLVPIPKLSVSDKYATLIHNVARCGAISAKIDPSKIGAVTAWLQYCSENSYDIVNQYYNYALKNKYTSDAGTSEMLDAIYNNIVSNREKAIEDLLGALNPAAGEYKWHSLLMQGDYRGNAGQIASLYTQAISVKGSALEDAIKIWRNLP